ncbi:MAG: hypothetical protein AVDCRST_MAG87-1720, partial [uncultured Thermomicrobiales bacterium]
MNGIARLDQGSRSQAEALGVTAGEGVQLSGVSARRRVREMTVTVP